jgi:hypothetical protein
VLAYACPIMHCPTQNQVLHGNARPHTVTELGMSSVEKGSVYLVIVEIFSPNPPASKIQKRPVGDHRYRVRLTSQPLLELTKSYARPLYPPLCTFSGMSILYCRTRGPS